MIRLLFTLCTFLRWYSVISVCGLFNFAYMHISMNYLVIIISRIQFCQLLNCNLFTQRCLIIYVEISRVKLCPSVHSFTLIANLFLCWFVLLLFAFNYILHTIRLVSCVWRDGKLDNLPITLGTRCFVCRSYFKLCWVLHSYWFDKPWFLLRKICYCVTSCLPFGVSLR